MENKYSLNMIKVGLLEENCYMLMNNETKEMIIVDPGAEPGNIISAIEEAGGKPAAVLITHCHHDHIQALVEIKDRYPGIKVIIGKNEEKLMNMDTGYWFGKPVSIIGEPDVWAAEGDRLELIGTEAKVLETPGHTCGSVCYYFPGENMLFTGDTLFKGTCGRTDFATGSTEQMMNSLARLACEFDDDTVVLPGHEDTTTIGYERKFNLYFNR